MMSLALIGYVQLTRGKVAIVDWEDLGFVNQWVWTFGNSGYATRNEYWTDENGNKQRKTILMHRVIMEHHGHSLDGFDIDHRDRQKLNNVYSNLRIVTRSQNAANGSRRSHNTSGVSGVAYNKRMQRWQAYITVDGTRLHLGTFDNKEDAVSARKEALVTYFGEHANLSDELSDCLRQASSFSKPEHTRRRNGSSGHFGICWHKRAEKWMVRLKDNGRNKYIGLFVDLDAAIAARDNALSELKEKNASQFIENISETNQL